MIKFYFNGSPNPTKVALMLHETGLPYEGIPVDPRRGEQFWPEYLKINPNAKVPALVDGATTVFDSNAILLYLATKTGKFTVAPTDPRYGEFLSWLMFVATGVGPFCGQAAHFEHFSPEKVPYAQKRYMFEAERHLKVVDERLTDRRYMLGDDYTIVDMSLWGWTQLLWFIMGKGTLSRFPNVKRHHDEIAARPAAKVAAGLRGRHSFKMEVDDEMRGHMFRHLAS